MKTLQNDFTTPEQSKRLMEVGVPVDSADCYYLNVGHVSIRQGIERDSGFFSSNKIKYMPCWSVGRLIEIGLKCSTLEQRQVCFFCNGDDDEYPLIDYVVTVLESGIMTNHMDFSKLEE